MGTFSHRQVIQNDKQTDFIIFTKKVKLDYPASVTLELVKKEAAKVAEFLQETYLLVIISTCSVNVDQSSLPDNCVLVCVSALGSYYHVLQDQARIALEEVKVNMNTATIDELSVKMNGVGRVMAKRMLEGRPFVDWETSQLSNPILCLPIEILSYILFLSVYPQSDLPLRFLLFFPVHPSRFLKLATICKRFSDGVYTSRYIWKNVNFTTGLKRSPQIQDDGIISWIKKLGFTCNVVRHIHLTGTNVTTEGVLHLIKHCCYNETLDVSSFEGVIRSVGGHASLGGRRLSSKQLHFGSWT
ncbi:hypothetical protein HK102_009617 [Quaeritorhiza haematococci]|nr:hypothetical protein HK102_009617 [Quaeritorhiza haematococci]